jgi:hypothetical protein
MAQLFLLMIYIYIGIYTEAISRVETSFVG